MDWDAFFSKFGITKEYFKASRCKKDCLDEIFEDYEKRQSDYKNAAATVARHLQGIKEVHSVRMRSKTPDRVIEKIIRKQKESRDQPKPRTNTKKEPRNITPNNYREQITDLGGVRALHLFKADWLEIHKSVVRGEEWTLPQRRDNPLAYVREGDKPEFRIQFEDKGCLVKEHDLGYRSIHYLVDVGKQAPLIVEIQTRTIFEEGWSEIDHRLRYKNRVSGVIADDHLSIFNRIAGIADEMASVADMLSWVSTSDLDISSKALGLSKKGEQEKALRVTERVRAGHPEDPSVLMTLAAVQDAAGKTKDARSNMKKASNMLGPDSAPASLFLAGQTYLNLKQWSKAAEFYGKYLDLCLDDHEARLDCCIALARSYRKNSKRAAGVLSALCEQLRKLSSNKDMCERVIKETQGNGAFVPLMKAPAFQKMVKHLKEQWCIKD